MEFVKRAGILQRNSLRVSGLVRSIKTCNVAKAKSTTGKTKSESSIAGGLNPQELLRRHKIGLEIEDEDKVREMKRQESYDQQRREAQAAAYQAQQLSKQREMMRMESLKAKQRSEQPPTAPVKRSVVPLQTNAEVALRAERRIQPREIKANYQTAQYCMNIVKQYDWENYVCSLLLKGDIRNAAMALRAFNVEMSKVGLPSADITTFGNDDRVIRIKYKFWEDAIHTMYTPDRVPDHPVLLELKRFVQQYDLKKPILLKLVETRNRPFTVAFNRSVELEHYAEGAFSPIYYSLLHVANVKNLNADHVASHLGKAQGITSLIRSIHNPNGSNPMFVPQEIMMRHNVSQERIARYRGDDQGVKDCIFEMASTANAHLEKARQFASSIPKEAIAIFLPAVAVERYLERLRQADFRLNHSLLQQRDTMLPVMYKWKLFWGKY